MQVKKCLSCPEHTLYCKSTCKHWEEHEKEKAKRYANNKIIRDAGLPTPTILYYNDFKATNRRFRKVSANA